VNDSVDPRDRPLSKDEATHLRRLERQLAGRQISEARLIAFGLAAAAVLVLIIAIALFAQG
jgi:hypothetical protein